VGIGITAYLLLHTDGSDDNFGESNNSLGELDPT